MGDVAWTLRVRARPGRHADSQSPRYTYTNPGIALTSYLRAESRHILDWFYLPMRLTVPHQYALGLAQVDVAGGKSLQKCLTSIKWRLWHGNAEQAVEKIMDLDDILTTHQEDPLRARKHDKCKPLSRLITNFQM